MINNIQLAMIKSKIEHIIQWFDELYKSTISRQISQNVLDLPSPTLPIWYACW